MSVAVPLLFALSGLFGLATIWRSVSVNLADVMELRRRATMPDCGTEILVTLRDPSASQGTGVIQRRLRHPARPKPVTHRLHQFGLNQFSKSRAAA